MADSRKTNSHQAGWIIGIIVVAVLVGAGLFLFRFQTYHFAVVRPGVLYRMGMRDTRELDNVLRRVHPKTVVCLVSDEEVNDPSKGDFKGEFAVLKKDGITLDRIRINAGGSPTAAQIEQFLHIVQNKKNQPVIVHCAQGVERTGMMVAAYQRDVLGYDKQQALNSVKIFGKGIERAEHVKQFIESFYNEPQALATSGQNAAN